MDEPLTFPPRGRDNATVRDKGKDAEIARLRAELHAVRAELEEFRHKHQELIDSLAGATVSAHAPDGTEIGRMRLLDELLRPGGERHLQINAPPPDAPPSEAPQTWAAWLAHRQCGGRGT